MKQGNKAEAARRINRGECSLHVAHVSPELFECYGDRWHHCGYIWRNEDEGGEAEFRRWVGLPRPWKVETRVLELRSGRRKVAFLVGSIQLMKTIVWHNHPKAEPNEYYVCELLEPVVLVGKASEKSEVAA